MLETLRQLLRLFGFGSVGFHAEVGASFPQPLTKEKEDEYFAKLYEHEIYLSLKAIGNSLRSDITTDEEKKIKNEAKKARNKLIEHNMRLVAHIAKTYKDSLSIEQEELIPTGSVGLMKAVDTYKKEKNVKFSSYAAACINNEIKMQIRKNKMTLKMDSLDNPRHKDNDGKDLTLKDLIADDFDLNEEIDTHFDIQKLLKSIGKLPERERIIVQYTYGLDGKKVKTQEEIAEILGIVRSYVSRLLTNAKYKIKEDFK